MAETFSFGYYGVCQIKSSSGSRSYPNREFESNGKNWGRWSFNIAPLQALRAGRTATVVGVRVGWQTSAKYEQNISVSDYDPGSRGAGAYIGSMTGPSASSYAGVSLSTTDSTVCGVLTNAIMQGKSFLYVSCYLWSEKTGHGFCRDGTLSISIEFEEAPPSTDIVQYILPSVPRTTFGSSVDFQMTIRNTSATKTVNSVSLRYVRYYSEDEYEDAAQTDVITPDTPISPQHDYSLSRTVQLYPAAQLAHEPGRTSVIKLIVTISGDDLSPVSQEIDFITALDRFYNPIVPLFRVVRGEDGEVNEDGTQQLVDVRISLDTEDDVGGFTLIAYYDGAKPGDETDNKVDFGLTSANLADFKKGYSRSAELIPDEIGLNTSRSYTIYLSDGVETSVGVTWRVDAAHIEVDFSGLRTGGVSFGKHNESTEDNPLFESAYPGRFYEGMQITGDSSIGGNLSVAGNIAASGTLTVGGIDGMEYRIGSGDLTYDHPIIGDEVKTPGRWIVVDQDGNETVKPIYRRVVKFLSRDIGTTSTGWWSVMVSDISTWNVDELLDVRGMLDGKPFPFAYVTDYYFMVRSERTTDGKFTIFYATYHFDRKIGYAYIHYTKKTTD